MRVISPTKDIAERLNSIYSQSETSDYIKVEERKQSLAAQIQQYEKLPFTKGALSNRYSALNAHGKNQYATLEIESSIKAAENRFYMPQKRNSKPRNRPLNTALNIIESDLNPKKNEIKIRVPGDKRVIDLLDDKNKYGLSPVHTPKLNISALDPNTHEPPSAEPSYEMLSTMKKIELPRVDI